MLSEINDFFNYCTYNNVLQRERCNSMYYDNITFYTRITAVLRFYGIVSYLNKTNTIIYCVFISIIHIFTLKMVGIR